MTGRRARRSEPPRPFSVALGPNQWPCAAASPSVAATARGRARRACVAFQWRNRRPSALGGAEVARDRLPRLSQPSPTVAGVHGVAGPCRTPRWRRVATSTAASRLVPVRASARLHEIARDRLQRRTLASQLAAAVAGVPPAPGAKCLPPGPVVARAGSRRSDPRAHRPIWAWGTIWHENDLFGHRGRPERPNAEPRVCPHAP